MTSPTPLEITTSAVSRLSDLIASKDNKELRLRVYVQGGGCSGFQYGFQFEEEKAIAQFRRQLVNVAFEKAISGACSGY